MPQEIGQMGGQQTLQDGEDPFYCLLQDDGLISHVSVETDLLLENTHLAKTKNELINDARLIIDVTVQPYYLTMGNIGFGT